MMYTINVLIHLFSKPHIHLHWAQMLEIWHKWGKYYFLETDVSNALENVLFATLHWFNLVVACYYQLNGKVLHLETKSVVRKVPRCCDNWLSKAYRAKMMQKVANIDTIVVKADIPRLHRCAQTHTQRPKTQSTIYNTETEWHQPLLSCPYAANTKGSLEQKSNQSSLGGFSPQQCLATLVALLVTKK